MYVSIVDPSLDNKRLQDDLYSLEKWQSVLQVELSNPMKCYTMCVFLKREPAVEKFTSSGKFLENVESHPYLGVEIDNRLNGRIT